MRNNQLYNISKILKGIIILSVLISISSCRNDIKQETLEEMITKAKANTKIIDVEDLKAILDNEDSNLIIDCRQTEDFITGHIPDAINIPRGILEFSDKISNRRTKVVVYNYDYESSVLCAETLLRLKYHDVSLVENGWKGWSETYPEILETGAEKLDKGGTPKVEESGGCGG